MKRHRIVFLPGAGGSPEFWKPVDDRLPSEWETERLGWPGLGTQPHDSSVAGIDGLVALVERRINDPVDLVAQSMGGVVAARVAISRPDLVHRVVLTATSAGVDMARFGSVDWRPDYRREFPNASGWITESEAAAELPVESISAPTLLIWGDADAISPVEVGRHLEERMPAARLVVLPDGDHELAVKQADRVAELVRTHLA